ncbi:hypothetical protein HPB50_021900 [Hyalomma asiaticum]|uniref:Uncharacterized protein n=1 Tax=Hyalomma asiaticum TaxID=266040 RepID=A0ACB7T112_HYAAI|nr:hypothetical protein HPB50_021900 [Hyalomma asiaticum]
MFPPLQSPWCQGAGLLLVLVASMDVCLAFGYCLRWTSNKKTSHLVDRASEELSRLIDTKCFSRSASAAVLIAMPLFVAIDSRLHRPRVTAVLGVTWRPVLSGLLLQFGLGLLLVRWHVGRSALACIAEKVAAVISFAGHGGGFVFGYLSTGELQGGLPRQEPVLVVTVVSTMVFFGLLISMLCHYGILQFLASRFARLIATTIGTTALESYCAACSIYLGMTDSAVLVKPYLAQLTRSELHTVMTCGFATVSGSMFAVFAIFGVKAEHMMTASVMSAPAALGFSKLFYPETEDSSSNLESINDVRRRTSSNVFESMARGVSSLLAVAANVAASLLGFVACVALADAMLAYVGALLGWKLVTMNWLVGRLFVPLALAMGLSVDESSRVASLVGLKTVLNEVFAQSEMGGMTRDGLLSPRAQLLCAHALCGFSSLGALGVQLGVFAALAPEKLPDCARVAGRALVAGSVACFLTACTAASGDSQEKGDGAAVLAASIKAPDAREEDAKRENIVQATTEACAGGPAKEGLDMECEESATPAVGKRQLEVSEENGKPEASAGEPLPKAQFTRRPTLKIQPKVPPDRRATPPAAKTMPADPP